MKDDKNKEFTKYNVPSVNVAVLSMHKILKQNSDIRGGREMILTNKAEYFTKLSGQDDPSFDSMVKMAPVYVLYPRVIDGFVGTIFSKDPSLTKIEISNTTKKSNKNIDLLGNSIDKYSELVVNHIMENGFCASMNDYSKKLNRPFIRLIDPNQFISFKTSSDNGFPEISQFIFKEEIEINDPEDEFDSLMVDQYTILDFGINKDNEDKKNYRVRIFQTVPKTDANKSQEMFLVSEKFPKKNGKFFDKIPLIIHSTDNNNFTIKKSILQDISDMNISVMQRVVDQTYMLHWTSFPTPWVTGVSAKESVTTIGPSKAWSISSPDAKVGILEFTGNSARAHQDFIDNLLYIMATTGAQILKKEGVSRETATSVLIRTSSQTSLVATLVKNASNQLESVFSEYFEWSGDTVSDDFSYKLNTDFIKVDMEPNAQIALVKSWLDGAISHKSMFDKMKEGELVDPNKTFEEEIEDILKNPPPFFKEKFVAQNAIALAEKNSELNPTPDGSGSGQGDDKLKGSNLENGNVDNKLGTEQV